MGCGASTTATKEQNGSPVLTRIKDEPKDSPKDSNYAESGPCTNKERPNNSATTAPVGKWQEKDVISWAKKIGLSQRVKVEAFSQFNGDLLIELWKLKQECPTVYYSALERDLAMAGQMDILKFNRALSACMTN
ncbi:uncharacterized protein LOC110239302 isoform X2 [Exaiptasia diaphana]|uniref:Uncharacterized protein n=1 Tax=Exaiptasia diaphana TaxID=2652724 RepID=A0A913X9W0_EXADI|nr:uncharacterized protein LOC110239302 isoform X2 [Exaiptasia diaphana]